MGNRNIDFEEDLICDNCGATGAYDFMGDSLCPKCTDYLDPKDDCVIEDGFGSGWSAWCPMCGEESMSIVRPGKVQCNNCE